MTQTRGSGPERAVHWTVAAVVLVMATSGVVMYVPALSELVGQRFWVRSTHLAAAVALVLVLLAFVALYPASARRLERQLSVWEDGDRDWFLAGVRPLADSPRGAGRELNRFNPGQKFFAALTALGLAVLLLTGMPMYWWGWFSSELVARARDLHLLATLGVLALLAGHVYLGWLSPYGLLAAGEPRETR